MSRNRLAEMRIEHERTIALPQRAAVGAIVDVRVVTNKGRRSIRIERVRDGFEIDKFAMDSRKVKRALPKTSSRLRAKIKQCD